MLLHHLSISELTFSFIRVFGSIFYPKSDIKFSYKDYQLNWQSAITNHFLTWSKLMKL